MTFLRDKEIFGLLVSAIILGVVNTHFQLLIELSAILTLGRGLNIGMISE